MRFPVCRICIVTPDIIGPVANGGIGTHCYFLANSLAKAGHTVHILFTGPFERGEFSQWRQWYNEKNITFERVISTPEDTSPVVASPYERQSLQVYEHLKNSTYDQIYFQDWQANGFHCIQAKRTMGRFARIRLTLTLHSSTEWINRGMEQWPIHPVESSRLQYCERYCTRYADTVLAPSLHMRDWVLEEGWILAKDTRHLPYILLNDESESECVPAYVPDEGVLAFFGRLETRKGLHLFCRSLVRLPHALQARIRNILFLGKDGVCEGKKGTLYIQEMLASVGIPYEIHTTLDSFAAQALLRRSRAVAFCPSLLDNLPYAILECACRGIPVMAAATGGIPEILPSQHCFPPTISGLTCCFEKILTDGYVPAAPLYDPVAAEQRWRALAEESLPCASKSTGISGALPKISVCVPHYNHGSYLPETLKSLAASDYPNFEVIVVDDGSTEAASCALFNHLAEDMHDPRFLFFHKKHEGPALCRNFCAEKASGELLVFMDSDNLAMPHMLSTFARSLTHSRADALTCHFLAFPQSQQGLQGVSPLYSYAPPGPALMCGAIENVFGDTCLIIHKKVFTALGGFASSPEANEDWEFLARLSLAHYEQDVIPEPLFWYRHTADGMSCTRSRYRAQRLALSAYRETLGPLGMAMAEQLLLPLYMTPQSRPVAGGSVILAGALSIGEKMERLYQRLFPTGSLRQRVMTGLRRKIQQP